MYLGTDSYGISIPYKNGDTLPYGTERIVAVGVGLIVEPSLVSVMVLSTNI